MDDVEKKINENEKERKIREMLDEIEKRIYEGAVKERQAWFMFFVRIVVIPLVIGVVIFAVFGLLPTYLTSLRNEYDYACIKTADGFSRALILDTDSERSCGFNCAPEDINVLIFIWDKTPKKVTFINNLKYTINVYHIVNGAVHGWIMLYPGETATFITVTDNDYFIETRGTHIDSSTVVYWKCG